MFRLPIVKFFSRILNRITITVVLVALQVAWLLWAFFSLTTGRVWVNAGLQLDLQDHLEQHKPIWAERGGMVALAEGHGQPAALDLLSALGTAVAYGQAAADCRRYLESQLPDGKTLDTPTKK